MNRIQIRHLVVCLLLSVQGSVLQAQTVTPELSQAIDRFLIHELQTRYAYAHDQTDPDAFAAAFTLDAEIHSANGLVAKGRDKIREMEAGSRERLNPGVQPGEQKFGPMRHMIVNSDNKNTGATTASGSCYVLVVANDKEAGKPDILAVARYKDEYRKVDGQWLIARREIIMDMSNGALMKSLGL
jgi:SnoaL-like domain